jgi:hypothetical protein
MRWQIGTSTRGAFAPKPTIHSIQANIPTKPKKCEATTITALPSRTMSFTLVSWSDELALVVLTDLRACKHIAVAAMKMRPFRG